MPPKKINKKKQIKKTVKKHKYRQSQTQNVYIYHQQSRSRKTLTHTIKTPTYQHSVPYHHVTVVPFQPPLPQSNPFINRPVQVTQTVPLNTNAPQTSALAAHVGAAPPLQTPHATPHTTHATPQSPVPKQKQKNGKKLLISNAQDGSVDLPKLADLDDKLFLKKIRQKKQKKSRKCN